MSVHQKADGRWFVRVRDKESGRLKDKYFGRGLEAERAARAHNESLGLRSWKRRTPKQQSPYFTELVQAYAKAKVGQMQPQSIKNLMWKMDGVIIPTLGREAQALYITPNRLDKYVMKRLDAGVKHTTIHREISDIRAVLNWSVKRGYLTHNPAAGFEMPKRDDEIIMPPTLDELNAIFAKAPDHLVRALALSYYTGLRPGGELYTITWNDFDCDGLSILIRSAKKNGRKSRLIPVHPNFIDQLKRWYHDDIDNGFDDTMTIVHYRRRPISSIKKAFATAKKAAGITRRLRPYDFRHAFASYLLQNSADLKSTSEMLGHTRTETTTRIYQHTTPGMHRDAINRLPALAIHSQKSIKKGSRHEP